MSKELKVYDYKVKKFILKKNHDTHFYEREDKQENVKMFLPAFMSCFGKRNYPDFFFFKWNNTL